MPSDAVLSCKVHPAIGIARVGNSLTEFFVGPEVPGTADVPEGGYKETISDGSRRVKRQAARFRVFVYDADGRPVRELDPSEATVRWSVHLVNGKAEWDVFAGSQGEDLPIGTRRPNAARNADVADRSSLIVDPGPRSVSGPSDAATFDGGRFLGTDVPLGELRTDDRGRLLVLGGFGHSEAADPTRVITNYANNDRWHDDTSDGPVTAEVNWTDGTTTTAAPAWVIVAPPDYAPAIPNFVTLYDVTVEAAEARGWATTPQRPSFTRDIHPILARTVSLQWTNARVLAGHGPGEAGGFPDDLTELASDAAAAAPTRRRVFSVLRNPYFVAKVRAGTATPEERATAVAQAEYTFMPAGSGDDGDATSGIPGRWMTLTRRQYDMMQNWAAGDFEADWPSAPVLRPGLPPSTPEAHDAPTAEDLDRAALEGASGGAFFPGIEAGWLLRNPAVYVEPHRLDPAVLGPGHVTRQMAVPWQADFFECQYHWWPWQRPDDVLTRAGYDRLREIDRQLAAVDPDGDRHEALVRERARVWSTRASWARSLPPASPEGDRAMVDRWPALGFVVDHEPDGTALTLQDSPAFVETETMPYDDLTLPEYFHVLVNIEDHPDFTSTGRELARGFFAAADFDADANYHPFDYTPEALDLRMDQIYDGFVATMNEDHWLDANHFSDAAVVEQLRQKAPFNLVDGAWLQNVVHSGPCNEIQANLFAIWADEAGNGHTELNHCNIYDTLLRGLDIYLPPITSREFIECGLLPSAFETAVFQMVVGMFPQEFLPELLGMTLFLEWEATPSLTPTVRMLEKRGIDAHFYRMHVAIDNIASGHGALAKKSIKLFLEQARESGGDDAVAEYWERIWRGYVTWATLGSFGAELGPYLALFDRKNPPDQQKAWAEQRMRDLITRKAPAARRSHGSARLGGRLINELFDDPAGLMQALLDSGLMDTGNPRESRFLCELLAPTGPMYKVFTEADQEIILDWLDALSGTTTTPTGPSGPGTDMLALLKSYETRARAAGLHATYTLPTGDGGTKSVRDWFTGPLDELMAALARSQYISPGSVADSTFFSTVVGEQGLMSGVLTAGDMAVIERWVSAGCPAPEVATPPPPPAPADAGGNGAAPAVTAIAAPPLGGDVAVDAIPDTVALQRALVIGGPLPSVPFGIKRTVIGQGAVH